MMEVSNSSSNSFGVTICTIPGASRTHYFRTEFIIKPRICIPCGKQIRCTKKGSRCQDCHALVHPRCREKLPVPCVPLCKIRFDKKYLRGIGIADLVSLRQTPLMIPGLIQQIVNELEKRLPVYGIYIFDRRCIFAREIFAIYKSGKIPNLSSYNSHSLAGCLLNFLSEGVLQEPLILSWYFDGLGTVINEPTPKRGLKEETLKNIISYWPKPNRETVAFLILHLKRIVNHQNGTTKKSLAKVFAPILLRQTNLEAQGILEYFLSLPKRFWLQFFFLLT